MKRFIHWLFKAPVLTTAGLLLAALLVWFEGPLLSFDGSEPLASGRSRWILIGVLCALPAAWRGWRLLVARRHDKRLAEGVAAPEPAPGSEEAAAEAAALGERMRAALGVLRKANPGWKMRGQYLYQLPWYMFVGVPGSGKTTALTYSGLHFPLAETLGPGSVRGVGGTRQCDWWFTDEAVLLDTAGRYTSQDSDAPVDRAAWTAFLGLLGKHRRRRPINGVIVAVSMADLLQQDELGRQAQAQSIRARIHELHEGLGQAYPVYVVVTKSDLLAGFAEFFEPLGREEREQVWGVTFPLPADGSPAAALALFRGEFDALERQLQARVLERMQAERDLRRRALLYGFPQQFAGIGGTLDRFLATVFAPNRYEQPALLRGVYFTSGTQEGSPIDRVMGRLAASFGLGRNVLPAGGGGGRSYFITRLLREVIFKEAGVAGEHRGAERRRRLVEWGGMGAAGLLALLLATCLAISYGRNQVLVTRAGAAQAELVRLAAATPADGSLLAVLPLLDSARALPAGYAARGAPVPLLDRMSLYQGEKLGAGAVAAYRRLLRSALLPRIVADLEDVLRRGDANNQDFLYETLRVYLMLGDRRHLDAPSVQAWMEFDWRRALPQATEAQRQALLAHGAALLEDEDGDPVALDAALVAQARLVLAGMPLPQRIYNRLKRQVVGTRLPEFSINGALGRDGSGVFARASGAPLSRGVPGLFSVAGFRRVMDASGQSVAEVAKDNWVLDRQEATAVTGIDALRGQVLQLYFTDYIQQWDAFLADLRLAPLASMDRAARIAGALSGADSPLRAFVTAAARETTLEGVRPASAQAAVDRLVRDRFNAARRQLEAALGDADADAPAAATPAQPVDQHFSALHKLVTGPAPVPLDQTLALVRDAALYFDAADSARRSGGPAPSSDALVRLRRGADGLPVPLSAMMQNIAGAGNSLAQGSERARLAALWAGTGAPFCRDAIAGRYPLVRASSRDATADDFGKFFGPGGLMDDFFAKNLAPFVDMSGARWRWRGEAAAAGVPQEALDEFQRGARVRDMFFGGGGRQPSLRFDLKPVAADLAFQRLVLDIDGQDVVFQPGQLPAATPVLVPSGKGHGAVRFEALPALGTEVRTEGPWAWLRMVDRAALTPLQGEHYRLAFDVGGRQAVYELGAGSVVNPFRREQLEAFHCPVLP